MKLPQIDLDIPRPKPWDLAAVGTVLAIVLIAAVQLRSALHLPPGQQISGSLTLGFVLGQLALTLCSLMLLGKTAKVGTLWGIMAAVAGLLLGMGAVLLAAALWATA